MPKDETITLKFVLPESDDRVDPGFDFERDAYSSTRSDPIFDDSYAHELLETPSADGLLMTRSIVTPKRIEQIRGAGNLANFLRLPAGIFTMGDCGAFQYRNQADPPYTPDEINTFYEELGFDYGISLDHMIFEFDEGYDAGQSLIQMDPSPEMLRRQEITVENAIEMLRISDERGRPFQLMGAVQGWSPESYRRAAVRLIEEGFDYLALGGLARASDEQIKAVISALKADVQKSGTQLHILGVARLSLLPDYVTHNVASCDSASSLLQAFKSNKDNYHTLAKNYTAVRIPPASGDLSPKVRKLLKAKEAASGESAAKRLHNRLITLEQSALRAIRAYGNRELDLSTAMKELVAYEDIFEDERRYYAAFEETLRDRPWENCPCAICEAIGIEVVILRGNNRNRRRGFHNTYVYYKQFQERLAKLKLTAGAASN